MPATGAKTRKNRDENINLRASQSQKALIDRAADALREKPVGFHAGDGVQGSGGSIAGPPVFRFVQRGIQALRSNAGQASGEQCETATPA